MLRDAMHKRWNEEKKNKIIQRRFYHADDCFWKCFRQNIAMTWFCAVYMSWTGSKQHNNNTHTFKLQKKSVETSTLLFIFTHDPNVQLSREDCSLRNRFCVTIVWVNPTTQEWLEFYLWQTCVANLGRGAVF